MNMKISLVLLLLLASLTFASTFLPVTTKNISIGRVERIPYGTVWADVRAYQFNVTTGYAACSGVNASRTCGACPEPNETAKLIVTLWNGSEVTTPFIPQGGNYTAEGMFKVRIPKITETNSVLTTGSGYCTYSDPVVTVDFQAYVQCASDGDCPNGYGCQNATYECVRSECNYNTDCADDEVCKYHQCQSVPRGACGEARNHAWVAYQCCADTDCRDGKRCFSNTCRTYRYCSRTDDCAADEACSNATGHCEPLYNTTSCGEFVAHQWVPYSCCSDSDCGAGSHCANHACVGCVSDSECADDSACVNSSCQEITGCGLVANHVLTRYQCCVDSDCFDEFACTDHACRPVPCECGSVISHVCIACTPTPSPTPEATATPEQTSTPAPTPTPAPTASPCPALFLLAALGLLSMRFAD